MAGMLVTSILTSAHMGTNYPHLPEHLRTPWPENVTIMEFSNARELLAHFRELEYELHIIRETGTVSGLFVDRVPHFL